MKIDTRISERLKNINPSFTLAITSKAKKLKAEGRDLVNFSAGEPDFDTPDFIKEAAVNALKAGFTKYTPTTGIPELKKAISGRFLKDNNLNYPAEQIVVSCGAKHSIFNALFVLLNRGDEVIIPCPYWVSYPEMVRLASGKPCFIKTLPQDNFKITPDELQKHIHSKTKALIINSPSNPAGSVYTYDELKEIARICAEKKIFIISDEIYEKLIYDNLKHVSIAGIDKDIYDLAITVNGLSKSYSMTGWRIGYLGGPADIVEAIARLQDHSTSNPVSISQKAAVAALNAPDDFFKNMAATFKERRDYAAERLSKIAKISFVRPQGAFYIFCDISKTKLDSSTFTNRLLEEALVSLIPGSGFGCDNYVRISFACSMEEIKKGMDRLEAWLDKQ